MIAFTDGSTTSYQYDALGRKLRVEHKTMTTGRLMLSRIGCGSEKFKQVWLPTRLALSFHPDTGTEDPGDVGSAPDPEFGEEAGEEGGEWQWPVEGEEWPELAGLEEMEGEEGEPAEGEEPTLPPTEPLLPPLPPTCLPYEITVTDYVGSYIYENSKLSRLLFDGGFYTFDSDSLNPECHYYFTDHLGSVRVVTDAEGNIEQTNNYYPYGGLMASSSCITNPSSSTAANQPNRYNGKELDRKNNLDWHDYGARHFDGIVWRNVDKLAEKYYSATPFGFCHGNPINRIDPDGMDEWEINRQGYIVSHKKTKEHDAFYIVNNKGKRLNNKSVSFKYGTVEKSTGHKDFNNHPYHLYQLRGDDNGTALFEFFAKNTDVEWSQIKTGIKGDKGLNFLTTSHEHSKERGSNDLYSKQLQYGYTVREDIHNHPENTAYASPGDNDAAYKLTQLTNNPYIVFRIFLPQQNKYIEYYQIKRIISLPEFTVKVKRKER